jgi:transposase
LTVNARFACWAAGSELVRFFSVVAHSAGTRSRLLVKAAGCRRSAAFQEDGVRVTTALTRLLALPGASVTDVRLAGEGVIIRVRLRRRRIACSGCGQVYRGMHDRELRRWRHLDLAGHRCFLQYELRRVECRDCGVRVEAVPWARRAARHTRDFEDLVAFCAQQMPKSQVQALLRVGWDTVGRIIARVVADHLDERRLEGLVRIGCDEICYRRGMRFLTNVADHHTGKGHLVSARQVRPDPAGVL